MVLIEAVDGRVRPLDVAAQTIEVALERSEDMAVHLGEQGVHPGELEVGEVVLGAGNLFSHLLAEA